MRKMMKSKKGSGVFDNLGAMGIGIMSLAIVLVVGFLVMSTAKTEILDINGETAAEVAVNGSSSVAYNATSTLIDSVADIPGWVPIIVITAIGALLIGMVAMFRRR